MNVYARYVRDSGVEYRFDTLLQFGDSWGLIGNVVLANPGSSNPLKNCNEEEFSKIRDFFSQYRRGVNVLNSDWFVFSPDSTMRQIEKIFNGFYTNGKTSKLNGVIQLFNCFNIKNQNLGKAIEQIKESQKKDMITSAEIVDYFGERAVYFGFSQSILNHQELRQTALSIFEKTPKELKKIFDNNFDNNKFYHPGYINRAYLRNGYVKQKMCDFYNSIK